MNMRDWLSKQISTGPKRPIPLLFYPVASLFGVSVEELVTSSEVQAKGLTTIADTYEIGALARMMELWVEAEAFGAEITMPKNGFPSIKGPILSSLDAVNSLEIPTADAGRLGIMVDAIGKTCSSARSIPVFAGTTGPLSLSGSLVDLTSLMMGIYTEPEMVHALLQKVTKFLTEYITAYKSVGAAGIIIAEPSSAMLSPDTMEEFSGSYIRQIIDKLQDDEFIVIYHNCGNVTPHLSSIFALNAAAYHFGDTVDMAKALAMVPTDALVMGNIDPNHFITGSAENIRERTMQLLDSYAECPNFVLSSGCDIPPSALWQRIDAFFHAVAEFRSVQAS